jgi:flagellar hook assembly protein FlgD
MVNAKITDMNGRIVKSIASKNIVAGENVISFNTDGLAKGMYLISIQGNNGSTAAKFTVQ